MTRLHDERDILPRAIAAVDSRTTDPENPTTNQALCEGVDMAVCSIGEISVECEGGCGLICWDHGHCRGWCEDSPTIIPVSAAALRASEVVTVCTKELAPDAVAEKLRQLLDIPLVRSRELDVESGDASFSGSFDELLEYLALEESDVST